MSKGRKVWSIILMVVGGLAIIAGFTSIKESWPSIIVGLIIAGVGVLLWLGGKRKVAAAEAKKQEELERLAAIEKDIEERTRSFWFAVEDPNQKLLEKIYAKQYGDKAYTPSCVIAPYNDEETNEYGFNVMVEDKKVGEVPRDNGPQVIEAINNGEHPEIYFLTNREMGKDGYIYSMTVTVKYLKKQ